MVLASFEDKFTVWISVNKPPEGLATVTGDEVSAVLSSSVLSAPPPPHADNTKRMAIPKRNGRLNKFMNGLPQFYN